MKGVVLEKETLKVCTIYTKNDAIEACLKQDFPEEKHMFIDVTDDVTIKNIKVNPDGTITTDTAYLYGDIRQKRNQLLAASDWTQFRDSPLTTEKQDEWAVYRQSLRDLPSTVADPTNVTWPTPPS
jgi:hypothetical protein